MINFLKKDGPKTVEDVLGYIEKLEKKVDELSSKLDKTEEKNRFSIKKIAIKRYNPFSGVGGDQSFSIALLDENNDGMIISSLFSQEGNRVYAKPVKKGASEYTLSGEEEEVMNQVLKV